jgi:iron complex transport system substrate-binding protein
MISRIFDVANVRLATEKYEVLNVHKVSDEEMVALNPHAMLIGGAYQNYLMDQLNNSPVWSALECNQQGRVYRIPVAMVGIENVSAETPVMLKYVASLFNPSYEFDMKTELNANIKKYFGYDLTDGDVENMCNALTKNGEVMVNAE